MPGRASAAFIPNFPSSDASTLSFDLTHFLDLIYLKEMGRHLMPQQHPHPAIMLQQVPRWPFR